MGPLGTAMIIYEEILISMRVYVGVLVLVLGMTNDKATISLMCISSYGKRNAKKNSGKSKRYGI